jgi:hypothetical protein
MKIIISLKTISLLLSILSSCLISESISNRLSLRDIAAADASFSARLQAKNKNCTEYLADGQAIINDILIGYNKENNKTRVCRFRCGYQSVFETVVNLFGKEGLKTGKDVVLALTGKSRHHYAICAENKLQLVVRVNQNKFSTLNTFLDALKATKAASTEVPHERKVRQLLDLKNYDCPTYSPDLKLVLNDLFTAKNLSAKFPDCTFHCSNAQYFKKAVEYYNKETTKPTISAWLMVLGESSVYDFFPGCHESN